MAFVGQTATQPLEVWLVPSSGRAEKVTKINDDLQKAALVTPEIYRYASFDRPRSRRHLRPIGRPKEARVTADRADSRRTDGPLD